MRRTHSLVLVARALLDAPDDQHWGFQLSQQTGVPSGVLAPLLQRLADEQWVTSTWETYAHLLGRPPRRYYRLTPEGHRQLDEIVQWAQAERRFMPFVE